MHTMTAIWICTHMYIDAYKTSYINDKLEKNLTSMLLDSSNTISILYTSLLNT